MKYTAKSYFFDLDHPVIQEIVEDYRDLGSDTDVIRELYIKVREGWLYRPFDIGLTKSHFKASNIAQKPSGHCIDKAILYTTLLRAFEIPARLHLAKVSNHIATERLEKIIGTNELAPHGMVDVYHQGKWVKCSPAFNKELCDRYQVEVLEFDGSQDAVFQEYNRDQQLFMRYLEDYGHFSDVPFVLIKEIFKSNYPALYKNFKGKDQILIQ
ncbi:transglutaminase-like domain-containing protein [Nonlabens xiamenensis]|uniref:transglutaminase-like domain-containing protein n=1 Tax=Nonlabens xiamenensis TaxID=2341043 RepID=UPI000F615632|nr:transglutaminase-like domain-containing protein [Nonlabens xiamenensis]